MFPSLAERLLLTLSAVTVWTLLSPLANGQVTPEQAPAAAASTTQAGATSASSPPITPTPEEPAAASGWSWLPMPKVTLPKITMPKIEMSKMPESAMSPIKTSATKISDGTKRAWQGTKELFSFMRPKPESEEPTRVASRPQPSLWERMTSGPQEPEGPRTIGEFMSGERPQ